MPPEKFAPTSLKAEVGSIVTLIACRCGSKEKQTSPTTTMAKKQGKTAPSTRPLLLDARSPARSRASERFIWVMAPMAQSKKASTNTPYHRLVERTAPTATRIKPLTSEYERSLRAGTSKACMTCTQRKSL